MRALRGIRVNRDAELVYYPVYLSVVTLATRNLRERERSTLEYCGIFENLSLKIARLVSSDTRLESTRLTRGEGTRHDTDD